jgi:hypothetical protein
LLRDGIIETQTRLTIYEDRDGMWVPVGMTSLVIDQRYGTAEFFIYLGDDGRGVGATATARALDWASGHRRVPPSQGLAAGVDDHLHHRRRPWHRPGRQRLRGR